RRAGRGAARELGPPERAAHAGVVPRPLDLDAGAEDLLSGVLRGVRDAGAAARARAVVAATRARHAGSAAVLPEPVPARVLGGHPIGGALPPAGAAAGRGVGGGRARRCGRASALTLAANPGSGDLRQPRVLPGRAPVLPRLLQRVRRWAAGRA